MFEAKETKKTGAWNALNELKKHVPQAQMARTAFDRNTYRNILFYLGIQWIRYETNSKQWLPVSLPSWFPKNQTNKFAVAVDGMKSVLEQSHPNIIYNPQKNEEEDISAADACAKITSVIDTEVNQDRIKEEIAIWVALAGNGFVIDGYDMSPMHGTKFVPSMACLQCANVSQPHELTQTGGCPACGGQQMMPALEDGKPVGEDYPIGKMTSQVEGPFGLLFDMQSQYLEDSEYIIHVRTYPTEKLKSMFPEFADKIQPGVAASNTGQFYQRAIAYITGNTGSVYPLVTLAGGGDITEYTTLYRMMKKPCKDLPYGGEALVADETELWKSEMSTKDDKGTPFYPLTHFGFKKIPGRVLCKTPADDLINKQTQRNKIEAIIQLGAERVSNPTWMIPTGIGLENVSGEPGEKLFYNGLLNGLKPERIQGADMPQSLYRWLGMIDTDFQDLCATYDVLLGKAPEGVSTLGGMQILRDRGLARFQDVLNNWGRGWVNVTRNRLMIWKQRASDERTMNVLGEDGKWELQRFSNATLAGSIDVHLEEGSNAPRSKTYDQMIASNLLQAGLLDASDPLTRYKLLTVYDAQDLTQGLDIDIKDAVKEREDFLAQGGVRPREIVDNHEVHLAQHIRDAKSDDFFKKWPVQFQAAWLQHINWHYTIMMKRAAMQRMQQPAFAKGQIQAQSLLERSTIENNALEKKKGIELEAKALGAEIKLGGARASAALAALMAAANPGLPTPPPQTPAPTAPPPGTVPQQVAPQAPQ